MKKIHDFFKQIAIAVVLAIFVLSAVAPNFSLAKTDYNSWTKKRLGPGTGHMNQRISADGNYAVVEKAEGPLHTGTFWFMKTKSKKPVWKFSSSDSVIFDLAISEHGDYIAAVGGKIWLFSKNSKQPLWSNQLDVSVMDSVAMTPDAKYIVTGDRFGEVFLFEKNSKTPIKTWKIGSTKDSDRDINKIAISDDGKYISVGSAIGAAFIDRDKSKVVWQYRTKREKTYGNKTYKVADEVMNLSMSRSGKYFAVTTEGDNQSDLISLYLFDKDKKTGPKWKYTHESFHTANVAVSGNGKFVTLSTNDKYIGFSTNSNKPKWTFELDGRQSDIAVSQNGKYIAIADALDYIHLFDRSFGSSQRPFRTYEGSFPDSLSLTTKGDKILFDERDLQFREIKPAVLTDLQDKVKAYTSGSEMNLRMFVTNPGKKKKLNVKVELSLPQMNLWETIGSQVNDENAGLVPKMLAKLFGEVGGQTAYDEDITFKAQESRDLREAIVVANLEEPDWYSSFFLGFDLISKLINKLGDVLKTVLPDSIAEGVTLSLNILAQGGTTIMPTLGLGRVIVTDTETGEVLDTDTFVFAFLVA